MPVDHALHAEPLGVGERLDRQQLQPSGAGRRGDRSGDRVLRRVLERGREEQCLVGCRAGGGDDVHEGHATGGHRAGLVEHDGVHPPCRFEHLRTLDEDAELGASAGPHHERRRRRESERAGAGDDEHGDGGGKGSRRVVGGGGGEPEPERGRGQRDDARHEHCGDAIGEPLHVGLTGLRCFDEPADLRERRVGTHPRGPDDEPAAGVHGRAGDRVARTDLDGHRFAGQQRGVDRRRALFDDAVRRHLLARADDEQVADHELVDGDPYLGPIAEHGDVLRAELEQRLQRRSGAPLGPRLEVAPGEDEDGHPGGDLEVDLARPHARAPGRNVKPWRNDGSPASPRNSAYNDQPNAARTPTEISVSIVAAGVAEVHPRCFVERPRPPRDNRGRQRRATAIARRRTAAPEPSPARRPASPGRAR